MDIWQHQGGGSQGGNHFTCYGPDYGERKCREGNLGSVGEDQTSSLQCSCPAEFIKIEYDIPQFEWELKKDFDSGITIKSIPIKNNCDPTKKQCSTMESSFSIKREEK